MLLSSLQLFHSLLLLAILLPGLLMMVNGHFLRGVLRFVLKITLIGLIPAAIWGVAPLGQDQADARHCEAMAARSGFSR